MTLVGSEPSSGRGRREEPAEGRDLADPAAQFRGIMDISCPRKHVGHDLFRVGARADRCWAIVAEIVPKSRSTLAFRTTIFFPIARAASSGDRGEDFEQLWIAAARRRLRVLNHPPTLVNLTDHARWGSKGNLTGLKKAPCFGGFLRGIRESSGFESMVPCNTSH